jgi:hypothetical protein
LNTADRSSTAIASTVRVDGLSEQYFAAAFLVFGRFQPSGSTSTSEISQVGGPVVPGYGAATPSSSSTARFFRFCQFEITTVPSESVAIMVGSECASLRAVMTP